jgi:hypothetical protein
VLFERGHEGYFSTATKPSARQGNFRAPDSLLKSLSVAENGTLSFRLKQSRDGLGFIDDGVIIQGPAGRLSTGLSATETTERDLNIGAPPRLLLDCHPCLHAVCCFGVVLTDRTDTQDLEH